MRTRSKMMRDFRPIFAALAGFGCLVAVACSGGRHTPTDAGSGGAAGAGGAGGAGGVDGDGIVVNTPSGRLATGTEDGYCDLLEAIAAANTDQAVHECPAGHGADRIILTAGASYPLARTLQITQPVTIGVGDGSDGRATVEAASAFVTDTVDRWSSCLIHARLAEGTASLNDLVLAQSPAVAVTGACASLGALAVRRVQVSGFRKTGLAAYCLSEFGCDHEGDPSVGTRLTILSSLISDNRSPTDGAGVYTEGSGAVLIVEHSAIIDNVAQNGGGGLYFGGGWNTHRINASTISGNAAASGAGVFVSFAACTASYVYIFNSTITRNIATSTGGGLEFHGNTDCYAQDVTVMASIIAGNTSTTTQETNINSNWTGGMFGCDRGALIYVAPGLLTPSQQLSGVPCRYDVADPMLAPLMGMGGPGNLPLHVPRRGSPVIDAATNDLSADQQMDSWIAGWDETPPGWQVFERVVDGDGDRNAARDLGAFEVNDVRQTELLAVSAKGTGTHGVVTSPDGYERGAGTAYVAPGVKGAFITYVVPIAESGGYAISVRVREAADGGQFQAAVADSAAGPWTDLGVVQDTYAATDAFATLNLSDGHSFATAGAKLLRFTVTGHNIASSGQSLYFDSIRMRPLP